MKDGTFRFDVSDSSMGPHPFKFSTTSGGTHSGGSEYTTGVTTSGTTGQADAYVQIQVAASAPTLYYYCQYHSGYGLDKQIHLILIFGEQEIGVQIFGELKKPLH